MLTKSQAIKTLYIQTTYPVCVNKTAPYSHTCTMAMKYLHFGTTEILLASSPAHIKQERLLGSETMNYF
jgi:hypothetical protein